MGRNYKQITLAERCQITQVLPAGFKVREIAAALDRAPSTISRELKRNGSRTKGYDPCYAQQRRAIAEAPQPDKLWKGCGLPGIRRLRNDHRIRPACGCRRHFQVLDLVSWRRLIPVTKGSQRAAGPKADNRCDVRRVSIVAWRVGTPAAPPRARRPRERKSPAPACRC